MALGYATGTVVGLNALWDALDTFMTGTLGWTKAETVNSRDAIYKSAGVDGKVNMVFRVSASTSAANPFKASYNVHKQFPWIFAQGYNTWTPGSPGSGTGLFGQVGPWAFGSVVVGGTFQVDSARIHRFNGAFPLSNYPDVAYPGRTRRVKTADSFENNFSAFDGRRKIIGWNNATNTQLSWSDIAHGEAFITSGGIPPQNNIGPGINPVIVHDLVNDKDLYFSFNNTATLAQQWLKYDVDAATWSTMAAPIWTASATNAPVAVWDGNDTIYCHHGQNTTEFAKYSISGNSWTNLTASPVARPTNFGVNNSGCTTNCVYVPNAISGIGQDVIYVILAISSTVIYRYRVTDNAWDSTSGAGALTAQQQTASNTFFIFDGIKYLYYAVPSTAPNLWYRSDVSVAPNTWTTIGNVNNALRSYSAMQIINHIPAKVRSHASANTTYWFLGDLDSCTVVVKVGTTTPHYYWMYFGRFSSSNRADIMTTTSPVSTGTRVSIPVDDSSKYSPGDVVVLWDPANGTTEKATLYDVPNGLTVTVTIANNYGTGTRIAIDPTQWICGGNGMGLCPTDASGTMSDNEPAQYILEPTADANATKRSSPGVRSLYQPVPISIFNDDSTTQKYENRGFLKNTFALATGAYPQAQSESNIKIAGKTYIFFNDTETSKYTVDTRGVLIGPID